MSAVLRIADARLEATLAGDAGQAGRVQAELETLLTQRVLPKAVDIVASQLGDDTVVAIPDLAVSARMTLDDLLSSTGVDDWVDAMVSALQSAIRPSGRAQHFESQAAYRAAYIRWRLGLAPRRDTLFGDMGHLALLSPARVWAETARDMPALWRWLADDAEVPAEAIVRALVADAGPEGVRLILSAGVEAARRSPDSAVVEGSVAAIKEALRGSVEQRVRTGTTAQGMSGVELGQDWLMYALRLGRSGLPDPVLLAAVAVLVPLVAKGAKTQTVTFSQITDVLSGFSKNGIPELLGRALARLTQTDAGRAAVVELCEALTDVATPPNSRECDPQDDHDLNSVASNDDDTAAAPADVRVYHSAVAGSLLCLPFLMENQIGAAFPAHLRHAALCGLVDAQQFRDVAQDDALSALCGTDNDAACPDRPNGIDLLFVAPDARVAIAERPHGASRLTAWLVARLAASLPGLEGASTAFLRTHFIHRAGRLEISADRARLILDPMPLRAVVDLAGLTGGARCEVPWCENLSFDVTIAEHADE